MDIIAGFSKVNEVKQYLEAGADELYCGMLGEDRLNHRPNTSEFNLKDVAELSEACSIAKQLFCPIYLVINETGYTQSQLEKIKKKIQQAVTVGVDGFILADIPLIQYVKKTFPECKIISSVINPIYNTETAKLFINSGVDRITFPRHILPSEIKRIRDTLQLRIETKVFFHEVATCQNYDCFCKIHSYKEGGPTCIHYTGFTTLKGSFSVETIEELNKGYFIDTFAYLYESLKQNITSVKLGLRGSSLDYSLSQIRKVKQIIALYNASKTISKNDFMHSSEDLWKK